MEIEVAPYQKKKKENHPYFWVMKKNTLYIFEAFQAC